MVLSLVICRLRRFECQGVDVSCRNFTYSPAKPQPRHIEDYTTVLVTYLTQLVAVVVAQSGVRLQSSRFNPQMSHFFLCQTLCK